MKFPWPTCCHTLLLRQQHTQKKPYLLRLLIGIIPAEYAALCGTADMTGSVSTVIFENRSIKSMELQYEHLEAFKSNNVFLVYGVNAQ